MAYEYTLFATDFGLCGIAWTPRGIACLQLPDENEKKTTEKLLGKRQKAALLDGDGDAPNQIAGRQTRGAARNTDGKSAHRPRNEPRPAIAKTTFADFKADAAVHDADGLTDTARQPGWVREAVQLITLHLAGKPQNLSDIPLDLEGLPPFHRQVYGAARSIASGRTVTYGELASVVGSPHAARAVGQAMAKNPIPLIIPCHRVLAASRRPGGFSAFGGLQTKMRLLANEGATFNNTGARSLFAGDGQLPFSRVKAVRFLKNADRRLGRLMEKVGSFRLQLEAIHQPFASLMEAIVFQQLSGKAASTILSRVKALWDQHQFPSPAQIIEADEARLQSAGLSRPKIAALKDLAAKTLDGTVPTLDDLLAMSDQEIVDRLTAVRGVGTWTVQMLLIFRLGRPDVMPSGDYGIRKGFAVMLDQKDLPTPLEVEQYAQSWKPYRTVASWYLWRALELS